jgi:hypothetical protein
LRISLEQAGLPALNYGTNALITSSQVFKKQTPQAPALPSFPTDKTLIFS